MKFLDQDIAPLGMGCWPIGGAMYSGDQSLGYTKSDDATSLKTIHAALASGITLFDTAAAYGAGHSERLLAKALKDRPDAMIVTKIGIGIDEKTRQLSFDPFTPDAVGPSIEGCLKRLERDRIDLMLLHLNDLEIAKAEALFDEMDKAVTQGKLRAYGWSTDFTKSALAMAKRENFAAVEHAMNLFFDASRIQTALHDQHLAAFIRSPLAMGVLSGKYDTTTSLPENDIRASGAEWMEYYQDGSPNPELLQKMDAVRDILTSDGRSLVQGALCWIWAKNPANIPVPGARTPEQIEGLAGALAHGPLTPSQMTEIEMLIDRDPNPGPDRPR